MAEDEEEFEEKPDPITLMPELYELTKENQTDDVLRLLEDTVPPTHIDKVSGWTPLHWAALNGNIVLVKSFLQKGASDSYKAAKEKVLLAQLVERKQTAASSRPFSEGGDGVESATEGGEPGSVNPEDPNATRDALRSGGAGAEASEETKGNAENKKDDIEKLIDDDEQEEEEETSKHDMMKNTPLLWAAFKGHLRCVWLLLWDGYSPNDVDDLGNNAVHLAAVNGHKKVLKVLVDDGGAATAVNFYKNRPIDMATQPDIREMLVHAMEKCASYTLADIMQQHEINMKNFNGLWSNLKRATEEASNVKDMKYVMDSMDLPQTILVLDDALKDAVEFSIDEELISAGEDLIHKLEATQELLNATKELEQHFPIRTQRAYIKHIRELEQRLTDALNVGIDKSQLQFVYDLINRANGEYWLETMAGRLLGVDCAMDEHEHDMNRLKQALDKAMTLNASEDIVNAAAALHQRLTVELSITRGLAVRIYVFLSLL
jgi:ankyrin repeat protein